MPLLVSPWNDNLVSASDWLKQISHVAWPIRRTTQIWVAVRHQYMEFLCLFLTHNFAGKPVVVSWNVSCFLRLTKYVRDFVSKETVVLCWWRSKALESGFINWVSYSIIEITGTIVVWRRFNADVSGTSPSCIYSDDGLALTRSHNTSFWIFLCPGIPNEDCRNWV